MEFSKWQARNIRIIWALVVVQALSFVVAVLRYAGAF